eukprot:3734553-Pyramimonas_sp.AAC.1
MLPGANPEQKLNQVWREIHEEYDRPPKTACRLGSLRLHNICDPKSPPAAYPVLSSAKAAETRHLVP